MCIACHARNAALGGSVPTLTEGGHIAFGRGPVNSVTGGSSANVNALISGYKWAGTTLTYALPSTSAPFLANDPGYVEASSFVAVTGGLASALASAFAQFSAVSGLSISLTSDAANANMLVGRTAEAATAYAYLPVPGDLLSGDIWFGYDTVFDAPVRGAYGWATAIHEAGHALGLKHSHTFIGGVGVYNDNVGVIEQPVSLDRDSLEFTIMSYRSYVGQDLNVFTTYTNEEYSYPQTLMMLDIAALQQMYGADFTTQSGNTTYSFSATTGEMFVNGAGQGAPGGNRIFLTIWDGGGTDTYDFSNYTTNQVIDLTPGLWSMMSSAQRADLGEGNFARGNVFNALQYQNDSRSLIENAIGGSGADSITGNAAANVLQGGGGADTLSGGNGDDALIGGTDADLLVGGAGFDTVRYDNAISGVNVDIGFNNAVGGESQGDQFSGIEGISGSNFDDGLWGDGTANVLQGWWGYDWLDGRGGNDSLYGGALNDNLMGGVGADLLDGGDGFDYARYDNGSTGVQVDLQNGGAIGGEAAGDVIYAIEGISGTNSNDGIWGNGSDNAIYAWWGNDWIDGRGGNDWLVGGGGQDSFVFGASWGQDWIADFEDGVDAIRFVGVTGLTSFAQLTIVNIAGGVSVSFSGSAVIVIGQSATSITAADILI